MIRFAPLLAAVAFVIPTGAMAQASLVRAVPVTAQSGKVITGDALWNCNAGGCTTASNSARPAIACAKVVREIGAVSSFTAGSKILSADELAKCNARAKPTVALARN
jgi:hypothetical protein